MIAADHEYKLKHIERLGKNINSTPLQDILWHILLL